MRYKGGVALAQPVAPYQGVYALIDPYNAADKALLDQAAQLGCADASSQTPFCQAATLAQAATGIYLQTKWCSFQLYAGTLPVDQKGNPDPNYCNYIVNGSGNVQFLTTEQKSPCNPASGFDSCSNGILTSVLSDIVAIDTARTAIGLPDLQLEIGLQAGAATAYGVLQNAAVGTTALPAAASDNNLAPAGASGYFCVQLPNGWSNGYIAAYELAYDSLLNTVAGFQTGALAPDITILKATPFNTISEE